MPLVAVACVFEENLCLSLQGQLAACKGTEGAMGGGDAIGEG